MFLKIKEFFKPNDKYWKKSESNNIFLFYVKVYSIKIMWLFLDLNKGIYAIVEIVNKSFVNLIEKCIKLLHKIDR